MKTTFAKHGRLWALLAVMPFFAACDNKRDERIRKAQAKAEAKMRALIRKHRPVIEAKVRNARATRLMLKAIPPAKPDAEIPALKPPIKLMERHMKAADATADVMFKRELFLLNRGILGSCSYNLSKDKLYPHLAKDTLPRCARVRYFLVVRPMSYTKPKLDAINRTYTGGVMQGDVVIFELKGPEPAKNLGTFPIVARLTGRVQVRTSDSHSSKEYEVNEKLRKVMLEAIEKKLPTAK